jgi:phosphoheptose isomerase
MNNDKKFLSPDSDTVAIWHGDYDYKTWLSDWLTSQIKDHKNHFALVIGFSASGNSPDVNEALKWASNHNIDNFLITGNFEGKPAKNTIDINTSHYYKYEILIIMLMYRLYEEAGYTIPKLKTRQ